VSHLWGAVQHCHRNSGGKLVEIGSSHAVMLSHPRNVAAFIKSAASAAK
jgi:hypothetical protein